MSQENITETILPSGFEITARQLSEMESVDFLLIDIRSQPSAAYGTIPGAVLIPQSKLLAYAHKISQNEDAVSDETDALCRLRDAVSRHEKLVLYCARGVFSSQSAQELRDLGFDAFSLTGAWMRTESWNNSYVFYDESGSAAEGRTDVALYAPGSSKRHDQQFATTLRATHNIPSIGFVVTLSAQAVWQEANWTTYGNDSIPLGYLSVQDASVHMFEPGQFTTRDEVSEAGYDYLLRNVNHNAGIKESYSPYFNFNINVTKEISDNFRVSFFANNMFRSYPRRESKRNPGNFTTLNNRFFFGLELSLTL